MPSNTCQQCGVYFLSDTDIHEVVHSWREKVFGELKLHKERIYLCERCASKLDLKHKDAINRTNTLFREDVKDE